MSANSAREPGLASEIVRLLGEELKHVREEIRLRNHGRESATSFTVDDSMYALQEENRSMKQEIDFLKAGLAGFEQQARSASQQMCQETEMLGSQFEARQRATEKLAILKGRYKQEKSIHQSLQESRLEAERLIQEASEEHGQASSRLDASTSTLAHKKAIASFDPQHFMRGDQETVVVKWNSMPGEGIPVPSQMTISSLEEELRTAARFMSKTSKEVLWSGKGKSQCLSVSPGRCYDVGKEGSRGRWENTLEEHPAVEEERELFYLPPPKKAAWRYMGTYRCVGEGLHSWEVTNKLANKKFLDTVFNTTVSQHWKNTAVVLKTISITDLYKAGVLRVACRGWTRIGVNQELLQALKSPKSKQSKPKAASKGAPIPIPTPGSHLGKRSRPAKNGSSHGKQTKKRKTKH